MWCVVGLVWLRWAAAGAKGLVKRPAEPGGAFSLCRTAHESGLLSEAVCRLCGWSKAWLAQEVWFG